MKKVLLALTCILLLVPLSMSAAKTVYIPTTWVYDSSTQEYTEGGNNDLQWSFNRSQQSDNCIVFWQKGFGSNPKTASISFDPDAVLSVAEAAYAKNITELGFSCSNMLNKYKLMILVSYTSDWVCYGGGYDFEVSALWIGPSAVNPAGHSLAHEVGHSFHYMCYAEAANYSHTSSSTINTGFHLACGNGQAIWEQTAQWQANQSYPAEMFGQSYPLFGNNVNYAFSHEWMRYQSYWFHYYLSDYYNDKTIISQIWKQPMTGQSNGNATDFCQAYMALKGLTASQFYERYFDYALKCATFDFTEAVSYRNSYVGNFDYYCAKLGEKQYQVAYHSAPQSTGFNVIELNVPSSGTTITTAFKALTHGCALSAKDPATYNNGVANASVSAGVDKYNSAGTASYRGFRVGYVFLKSDGTRSYYNDNTVHCTGTSEVTENISTTVPANTSRMFLVVAPALSTYVKHAWDENISNDDQWPYSFTLTNTDIKSGTATIYTEDIPDEPPFTKQIDGRSIADVTLTYSVTLPPDASGYTGAGVTFNSGSAVNALCTAFQLESSDIFNASKLVDYTASQSNNTIMSCALTSTGAIQTSAKNTNGTYGHWFNSSGTVQSWGSGCVAFTEINDTYTSATIGQYPNGTSNGTTRTVREGLIYKNSSGETAKATIVFNITFKTGATPTAYLTGIDYTAPSATTTVTAYRGYNAQSISLSMAQGEAKTYSLTDTNKSDLIYDLMFASSLLYSTFAGYMQGYNANLSSASSSTNVYYYALTSAPTATSSASGQLTFYKIASSTTDSEYSGQYVHYYDGTGTCVSNASDAKFKVAFNKTSGVFTVKATDDCPTGSYTIYIGMARRYRSNNTTRTYVAYFPITITVTEPTYTYTINVAAGAPTGAGFTTLNGLTGSGNTYSIVNTEITAENVDNYVTATPVSGYDSEITVSGTTITITYTEQPREETLNVERYPGQGYTATTATVDFTAAKTFLGVSEVTTDMLRIVNPDNTQISDYATYDGWFDADGVATTWGSTTKICVKFFQAISGGTYEICDMNGADVIGTTYTVKWALVANDKTYTYNINVTFVERPAVEIDFDDLTQVGSDMVVNFTSSLGSSYEGLTYDVNVLSILSTLSVNSLDDLTIYAVQSDGSLDDNYKLGTTDGWRNADGDWQGWGGDAYFCVKADFSAASNQINYVGGMDGNTTTPATYTATYAFVKNGSATNDAVILKVNLIYPAAEPTINWIDIPVTLRVQSRETESASIGTTDAQMTDLGLTWEQVRSALITTHENNNTIGKANHTLASGEVMLYPVDENGVVDTSVGTTYNDFGYWFNGNYSASTTNQKFAICLDWIGYRWVVFQNIGSLTAGDTYTVGEALLYNDGTETKTAYLKFNITVEEMPSITLADTQTEYEQQSGNFNVTLQRSLPVGKWLTFCAPFNISAGDWKSMGISEVRRLGSVTKEGSRITLNFTEETEGIWVGVPVIIQMSEAKTGITKTETGYGAYDYQPTTTVESGTVTVQFIGTYVKMALPNNVYYIQDDLFRYTNYTGTAVTNMKGFRGYFTITDTSSEVKELSMTFDDEEVVPTAIDGMDIVVNDRVDVYTLTGVKVKSGVQRLTATESLPSGIYIIGGKKQFVK